MNRQGKTQDCFTLNRPGRIARLLGRRDATCKRGLVERCEDLQKQRRAVESEVQKDGGTCLSSLLLWKRKLVMESCHSGQHQRMGNNGDESSVSLQKKEKDETWSDYDTRTARIARNILVNMNLLFFVRSDR